MIDWHAIFPDDLFFLYIQVHQILNQFLKQWTALLMLELKISIKYDSVESLLELNQKLELAYKLGFRKLQVYQTIQNVLSLDSCDPKDKMLTKEVIKYLSSHKFDVKFNHLTISIGMIQHLKFVRIVDNLKNCPYITSIMISCNKLSDSAIEKLVQCRLVFLKILDLSMNNLTWKSLHLLSQCQWQYLTHFLFKHNKAGNRGITYLAKTQWKRLKHLELQNTNFTNDGMKEIVRGNWPLLTHLSISQNGIKNEGIRVLVRCHWKQLSYVLVKDQYQNEENKFIWLNQYAKLQTRKEKLAVQAQIPTQLTKNKTIPAIKCIVNCIF